MTLRRGGTLCEVGVRVEAALVREWLENPWDTLEYPMSF